MKMLVWIGKAQARTAVDRMSLFEAMYAENFTRVFKYIAYRVEDRETAEDLTSAVFERALSRLDQYDADEGAFIAWLFSIARSTIANHYRTRQRRPAALLLDDEVEVADPGATPEEQWWHNRQQQALRRLVRALPERDQELIALKFGAGLNHREIGSVLRLSESNVGTILHRAVRKLREQLQAEGWEA